MNKQIEAVFFDGLSSAPKHATIELSGALNEINISLANDTSLVWELKDIQFEEYGGWLEMRNKRYSGCVVKTNNHDFVEKFYKIMKSKKSIGLHTRLLHLGFSGSLMVAGFLLGCILLLYFFVLPVVAEKTATYLPDSFDNEIGNTFIESFLNESEIDSVKTGHLEEFAANLNLQNKKPLHFTVVKSEEVNAFAAPNGHIVIYTEILKKMKSADELTALIGHEASHINNRHTTKMLCRNLAGYLVVSLLFTDVNGVMAVLAENAQQLHSLSYSRKFEQEADEHGLKILMNNKINPEGMIGLFEQLDKEKEESAPEIFSTHPLTKERVRNMKKIISGSVYEVKKHDKLNAIFEKIKS